LDKRGWSWAVGGILADSLGGGDPDGRNPGRIGWRRNIGTGGRGISRRRNSVGDSARAVSDGQGLTGCGSVCLGSLGEGGRRRAISGVDIGGNSGPDN
jgi:hypothetical protein